MVLPSGRFRRFPAPGPALVAAGALLGTLALSQFLVSREQGDWIRRTESEVRHVAAELDDGIARRFEVLERAAGWWLSADKPVSTQDWLPASNLLFQGETALQQLVWLDPVGWQLWSVEPGLPPGTGRVPGARELRELALLARRLDSMAVSPVHAGSGGAAVIQICRPVQRNGRTAGYIAATFDARKLAATVLTPDGSADYSVEVFADGHTVHFRSGPSPADRQVGARRASVPVGNRSWVVELRAAPEDIRDLRALVLSFGILATALLYAGATAARTSRNRAALLEKANAALHSEVRMRQRVEEKVSELNLDLQRRLSEFQTLLEVLPVGIAVADDASCARIWTNPALARIMGIPEGSNISKSAPGADQLGYRLCRDGVDVPPEQLPMQVAARTGKDVLADELEIVRPDGGVVHTLSYSAPLFDENGRVRGVLDACVDISERKQLLESEQQARREAERTLAALRASESNFQRLIDSDVIGILVVEACRIVDANEYFARLTGIPRDELKSGTVRWKDVTPSGCSSEDAQHLRRLLAEERVEPQERELVRRDGSKVPVLMGAAQLESSGEWKAICFVLDQTNRRELERRLRRAEKLNSLARMAGGIAHDFNNLLTGILGNASLASDFLAADDSLQPILSEIMKSSNRAADLVAQILAYTGRALRYPQPLNLSQIVRDTEPELARMAAHCAQLQLELAEDLPPVYADREQMSRVLCNLTSNAVEALPPRDGRIQIRTSLCEISPEKAGERFPDQDLEAGLYVRLEVSDNGHGIPEEVAAQMFDPFFTTRFVGRGLGLSAVQGVVRAHGGGIRVSTSAEAGTLFEVVFPAKQTASLMADDTLSTTVSA